ncbi:MAG: glycosyltransferase [Burkholderiales bacterium]
MRIAFLLGSFPVTSETFVIRQIAALLELGHDVSIFADLPEDGEIMQSLVRQYRLLERTTYVRMPRESGYWEMPIVPLMARTWVPGSSSPILNAVRLGRALPTIARAFRLAPSLAVEVLRPSRYGMEARSLSSIYRLSALASCTQRFEVAHAHFGHIANRFRFVRRLWGIPFVVTFHGFDFTTWPREHGADVYRDLFDVADAITIHTGFGADRLIQLGCPRHKICRLPVGIDVRAIEFRERGMRPSDPIRFLTVARLVEIKGLEYSIRAFARLGAWLPGAVYDIVGGGADELRLRKLASELGLDAQVRFHGAQGQEFVKRALSQADIFVLPSINRSGDQEGQSVALLEAQAAGLPIVATRTGGIPEVILDCKSGFLVADRDSDALAERMLYLAKNPHLWPEMGRAGRLHVEQNFAAQRLDRRLVKLYQDCAGYPSVCSQES